MTQDPAEKSALRARLQNAASWVLSPGPKERHPMPLRNPNINYERGWFFVTIQVAHNKTMFGVSDGGRCLLTELGKTMGGAWQGLFARHPEIFGLKTQDSGLSHLQGSAACQDSGLSRNSGMSLKCA